MNGPMRLRDGQGAARRLMAGSVMHVPSAARRRALAFTSAAATMGAGATAAASSATSLVKSFVLCVALGAVGGGATSLLASETFARLDAKPESSAPSAAPPTGRRAMAQSLPRAPEVRALETPPEVAAPAGPELAAKEASSKSKSVGRDEVVARGPTAAEAAMVADAAMPAPSRVVASLFEEQRIIESARAAVARGDVRGAFALLDDYERAYASKQFRPEALALRIEALRSSGQGSAARTLAAEFAQKYPHHPLLQQVQSTVAR